MPVPRSSLFGVHQKIERAYKHIKDLQNVIERFRKSNPITLKLHSKKILRKNTKYIFEIEKLSEPPRRTALILGDALHNLRSSLNYLAYELCLIQGIQGKHLNKVKFPIAHNPKEFSNTLLNAHISKLSKDLIDRIETVQPYQRGFESLSDLNILNNRDKHRTLVITPVCGEVMVATATANLPESLTDFLDFDFSKPTFQSLEIKFARKKVSMSGAPRTLKKFFQPFPLKKGDKLPPIIVLSHLELKDEPFIIIDIGVERYQSGDFIQVGLGMLDILVAVKQVVKKFEKYFK